MKVRVISLAAIAFTAASVASTSAGDSKTSRVLDQYERTGETRSCISLRQIKSIKAIDDSHLLVRVSGNQYYLNHVSGGCPGASESRNHIEYRTPQNQLCSHEIVRVVDSLTGHSPGSCGLGDFERLEKPA